MESFKSWAAQLIAIILVGNFVELLMPFGNTKKYVRMSMGLLILTAILNPILGLISQPDWLGERAMATGSGRFQTLDTVPSRVTDLQKAADDAAARLFRNRLEREALRLVMEINGIGKAEARAELDHGPDRVPALKSVEVLLTPKVGPAQELAEAVRRRLSAAFGIQENAVTIRWAGN